MKTKMKILIFGAKGWIGGMLVKEWKRLYPEDEIGESMVRVHLKIYKNSARKSVSTIV